MIVARRFYHDKRIQQTFLRRSLHLQVSEKVQTALQQGKPVVALESTIISHGMPFPRNLEVARKIEQTVIENGAVPATIAIVKGVPKIGLEATDLEILANKDRSVIKASTRDLAFACNQKLNAATTVASTMKLASLAGIQVFATGGIGGVHRGAEVSMDISADLIELGRTPVTVVCAGIKSILDIGKSLEVLETQGVPVFGFQTDQFPAFFTRSSGLLAPDTIQSAKDVADMILINERLNIRTGMVIAVPNPDPLKEEFISNVIASAVLEAELQNITGPKITPYLLSRIEQLSQGKSLESNIALVMNNAKVAANIASELAKQRQQGTQTIVDLKPSPPVTASPPTPSNPPISAEIGRKTKSKASSSSEVVVVGGAVVDIIGNVTSKMSILHTSNPGVVQNSFGGVGRNIAEQLSRLGISTSLSTAVAKDSSGRGLIEACEQLHIDTSTSLILDPSPSASTACYTAIHDNSGELVIGIADMNIFSLLDPAYMRSAALRKKIEEAKIIIADGNLSKEGFIALAQLCEEYKRPLFFEPTSDHKCLLPFHANAIDKVSQPSPHIPPCPDNMLSGDYDEAKHDRVNSDGESCTAEWISEEWEGSCVYDPLECRCESNATKEEREQPRRRS